MHAYGPRKQRPQSAFRIALGLTVALLLGWRWIRSLFNSLLTDEDSSAQTQSWSVVYTEGASVILGGQIRSSLDLKAYSHVLTTAQQERFWLKSSTVDLSLRTWNIQVKGIVSEINDNMPIITVTDVVGQKLTDSVDNGEDPTKNDQFFWFQESSLAIDTSMSNGFEVQKMANWDIVLNDTNSWTKAILTISPFTCTPGDNLKDCTALQKWFEQTQPDTFISSAGISYHNLPETKTRVAIYKNRVWFYVVPNSQERTSFTSMIRFLDKPTIEDALKEKYQEYCYDLNSRMSSITSMTLVEQQQWLRRATLNGPSSTQSPASCTVLIRLGMRLSYFPQAYTSWAWTATGQQQVITQTTGTQTATTTPTQPAPTSTGAQEPSKSVTPDNSAPVTAPAATLGSEPERVSWSLSLPSVRGYTIYFSKKWIRYAGSILEEPLTIGGATCIYKLDIMPRQAAEDAQASATLYECSSTPSGSNAGQLVGQVGGMSFVLLKWTTDLQDLEVYVGEPQIVPAQ